MATASQLVERDAITPRSPAMPPSTRHAGGAAAVLDPWLKAQATNVSRHAAALRPFRREEFGTDAAAPSESHIHAANQLIGALRRGLLKMSARVTQTAKEAREEFSSEALGRLVKEKDTGHRWVQGIEKIWDFYLELFGQRQSKYANWLLSCDRIAMDCYQVAYMGLGKARSIPAPPPFSYMRTGFAPATFRRGIRLTQLGKQLNPFPLVQLPYHRLVNPWTLGAVLHEVSHNLQSDLGLSREVPRNIALRLLKGGLGRQVAMVWTRWNREMFADMFALLMGGPHIVGSLMDVVGRAPSMVMSFSPQGVHPTPYLRTLISAELLRRMGFSEEAKNYRQAWMKIYPNPRAGTIPTPILETFPQACALAVDAMCYQPYAPLGQKSLAQVFSFGPKEKQMVEEAARRLAAGTDPGIIPERFLISASREALEKSYARPGVLMENFYKELVRR
jgi:hypothetical protein